MIVRRLPNIRMGRRGVSAVLVGVGSCLLSSCGLVRIAGGSGARVVDPQEVVAVTGWTRIETTKDFVIVINVLPAERMFSADEVRTEEPSEGELIISGVGLPVAVDARHVEAHIYARETGKPLSNVVPTITILNRTTSTGMVVPATLMQDLNVAALDVHYGNNVVVSGNSDVVVSVSVAGEEVSADGHLA